MKAFNNQVRINHTADQAKCLGPIKAKNDRKQHTNAKNKEKRPKQTIIFLLCKYLNVPRAYENINSGLSTIETLQIKWGYVSLGNFISFCFYHNKRPQQSKTKASLLYQMILVYFSLFENKTKQKKITGMSIETKMEESNDLSLKV